MYFRWRGRFQRLGMVCIEMTQEHAIVFTAFIDFFRNFTSPVVIIDPCLPDSPIIFANPSFLEMTGFRSEEVHWRGISLLYGSRTDKMHQAEVESALHSGCPATIELISYKHDGNPFWNKLDLNALYTEDTIPSVRVVFMEDVTKNKREASTLRLQNEAHKKIHEGKKNEHRGCRENGGLRFGFEARARTHSIDGLFGSVNRVE